MYGFLTYISHKNQPNVGKQVNIPYMDPMGMNMKIGSAHFQRATGNCGKHVKTH